MAGRASIGKHLAAYNNIRSTKTLTEWPVLPQLWELNLHDHVIDDDGLVTLAVSRNARSLVELDLEQDDWNTHQRSGDLPAEVVAVESFHALDALFIGVVDEDNGDRYSARFRAMPTDARPELVAFLTCAKVVDE